jgi:hypothetical protein
MTGTHEEARRFNLYLKTLEQQVYDAHRQLLEAKIPVTVKVLKDKLFGKEEKPEVKMLVPIFEEHNRRIAALVGKDYAAGTLERYTTSLKHTIEFMWCQYKVGDVDIQNIDHEFIAAYEFFLRCKKNCCNNTTVKYLKNFKKIVRICLRNHWLNKDPFAAYKAKLDELYRHS